MKTTVEALEDNKVKLTVVIDAKEVDDRIKKTYNDFAYKYNFPGFRRGKAPRPIIDSALGAEAVPATVTDAVYNETYPLAVDENNLYPVAQPEFEDQDTLVQGGKEFTYTATLEVKPEFELTSYDPVEIEMPGEEATEEEIQQQIDQLRDYYVTMEDAPASAKIAENDYAEIAVEATDQDGNEIESLTTDSRLHGLGVGIYPPSFDEQLVGLKKGDKKSFDYDIDDEDVSIIATSSDGAEKVHFEIEIKAVQKKVLPEVTDEWAEQTGFESVADLKERVAESITQQKKEALAQYKETECLYALGERLKGDLPEAMVESTESELLSRFFQQLQQQGMSLDSYMKQQNLTSDQFKEDVRKQAEDVTKQDLALDAWAREKKFEITGKDITEEFMRSGAEDPKALEADWRKNGRLHILREQMLRQRASQELLDTAVITEPKEEKEDKKAEKKASTSKKASEDKKTDEKATATKAKASTKTKAASKSTTKKSEDKAETAEKKPAAKKTAAKKAGSKKAADEK